MQVAVYGLGYVGLVTAACLAKQGHRVIGVDVAHDKVEQINRGISPIVEPGLQELLSAACSAGQIRAVQNFADEINACDIAFVCVGTPSGADGSHNMSYVGEVSRQIANAISPDRQDPLTVVFRSTMRPGTIENFVYRIFAGVLGNKLGAVELVYNPEFLRESVAISDFFHPPKIVIGTNDGKPAAKLDQINEGLKAPVFYTSYREAEFTKFIDNTFHALKVAFANEIARICFPLGVDVAKVHEIFISDTKLNISPYYLRPGGAFGGSCLPKDLRALNHMAKEVGACASIIDSIIESNDAHKNFLYEYSIRGLPKGARILQVGLSFKANSDDLRESPNLDLASRLVGDGFNLQILDEALDITKLIGQNLAYGYSHFPSFASRFVSREEASRASYDLVIDTNNDAKGLELKADRVVSLHALT